VWTIFAIIGVKIKAELGLNDTQFGLLVGTPILTGSLVRLFLGCLDGSIWWAHRLSAHHAGIGGCRPFCSLMPTVIRSCFLPPLGWGWRAVGFAVGVAYVSKWYPQEKQGSALGFFGMGNVGAAVTKFVAPWIMVAAWGGRPSRRSGQRSALTAITLFFLLAQGRSAAGGAEAHGCKAATGLKQQLEPLRTNRSGASRSTISSCSGPSCAGSLWLPRYLIGVYGVDIATAGMLGCRLLVPGQSVPRLWRHPVGRVWRADCHVLDLRRFDAITFMLSYPPTDYVVDGMKGTSSVFGFDGLIAVCRRRSSSSASSCRSARRPSTSTSRSIIPGCVGAVGGSSA
jgi:NNP family nitrate/nitrite transporter-like MFS transporter